MLRKYPSRKTLAGQGGLTLLFIIVLMMIFSGLSVTLISLFSSSIMVSSGIPNESRTAAYVTESGTRYAVSELRNAGYKTSTISRLNSTTYSVLEPGTTDTLGQFDLNLFGRWFEANADYASAGSGTLVLKVPEGTIPNDFSIPSGVDLVNLEGYRDAWYFSKGTPGGVEDNFTTRVSSAPDLSTAPFNIQLSNSFEADADQPIHFAVQRSGTITNPITIGGSLRVNKEAADVFPAENGSFYVVDSSGLKNAYYYEKLTVDDPDTPTYAELTNIQGSASFTLSSDDYVILSEWNHIITSAGSAGEASSGGNLSLTANFRPNITTPQDLAPPPAGSLPEDISAETFTTNASVVESTGAGTAVSVDTDTGKITLGGGATAAFGSIWFQGNVTIGGFDVCTAGKCDFNDGIRAYFSFTYSGSADGFTFALMNGTAPNATTSTGGSSASGEYLGYAGDGYPVDVSRNGLQPPKMAIEFDTYTNAAVDDPGSSNKDYIQFVYWGDTASNLFDDNTHDTGGPGEKWSPYATVADVKTKPALNSGETALYVNATGYLYGIDPATGASLFASPYYFNPFGVTSLSSPAVDSAGFIFMGENYSGTGYIDSIKADGSDYNWFRLTTGVVDSSPVIDSSGAVYFGTNSGYFYAYYTSSGNVKWPTPYIVGGGNDIKGTPALSADESTVYFVTNNPGYLYALSTSTGAYKWRADLNGPSYSSPTVADDGTIYVGSDAGSYEGILYAIDPNGNKIWEFNDADNDYNFRTIPAIGSDGTIYVGSMEGRFWAVNSDGSRKWVYPDLSESSVDAIQGSPLVHEDGTIWFGSNDNYLYVVDSNGLQIDKFNLYDDVQSAPIQGSDGAVYVGSNNNKVFAYKPTCNPRNIKSLWYTSDDLPAEVTVADSNNWLNSGPWGARLEVDRSQTVNDRGKHEYTLRMWIEQCASDDLNCDDLSTAYFGDVRVEYDVREPDLEQTIEICPADHTKFDTFLFGFTEATGGSSQIVTVWDPRLGFRRPGDPVVTSE